MSEEPKECLHVHVFVRPTLEISIHVVHSCRNPHVKYLCLTVIISCDWLLDSFPHVREMGIKRFGLKHGVVIQERGGQALPIPYQDWDLFWDARWLASWLHNAFPLHRSGSSRSFYSFWNLRVAGVLLIPCLSSFTSAFWSHSEFWGFNL